MRPASLVLAVPLALLACAPPDQGTANERVTSLGAARTWDSLSEAERDQVCDEVDDYYDQALTADELVLLECAYSGIESGRLDYSFTQDPSSASSTCADALDACIDEDPEGAASPLAADCEFDKYAGCTFLIAEYEACIRATAERTVGDVREFSCAEVDWTDETPEVIGGGQPQECQALLDKCP